ncbi:MAG: cupin domain-containing protein [Bacteroidota bacterium]
MVWCIEKGQKIEEKYRKIFLGMAKGFRSGVVCLKEGEEIGLHSTEDGEEIVVILSGRGTVMVNNEEIPISADDILYFGPHTGHNIKAKRKGRIHYVYIYSKVLTK